MAGRHPWGEIQQHPTSGTYHVGDVTESGGAAVHLGTSRGVRTFSSICTLLKPDLVLCIILESGGVVAGRGNGDRGFRSTGVALAMGQRSQGHTIGTLAYKSWRRKLVAHDNSILGSLDYGLTSLNGGWPRYT